MTSPRETTARLVVDCPDKPGIVAAVSAFLFAEGANIIHSDQHSSDTEGGRFYLRLEFHKPGLPLVLSGLGRAFQAAVADRFDMRWELNPAWVPKKCAILVSRHDHALMDLLWRYARGELFMEIPMVVSNHPDLKEAVENFGIPFHYLPVTAGTKAEAMARLADLLRGAADFVVLARYMQILPPEVVALYPDAIINIHHSFLPAFAGADPYRQALERGVKCIGATAHYVTEELDEGPIIEQDVIRVSHRHSVEDLRILGRDIERQVLVRAVRWRLEDRIIVHGRKTIVFV